MDLEKIYREYFTIVYRYTLSISRDAHLAEEITQETFVKAFQKLKVKTSGGVDIKITAQKIKKEILE